MSSPVAVDNDNLWYGDGWKDCSGPSLRSHLVHVHFHDPCAVIADGVARWDIELAAYRGLDLKWAVGKIYDFLERPDDEIELQASHSGNLDAYNLKERPPITALEYRIGLVRNLLFMEQLGMADIDWKRVTRSLTSARSVELNLDGASESFFKEKRIPHVLRKFRAEVDSKSGAS